MAKLTVVNIKGEQTGEIDLSDEVFGITEINQDLFYEIVKAQLASRRAGDRAHHGRGVHGAGVSTVTVCTRPSLISVRSCRRPERSIASVRQS